MLTTADTAEIVGVTEWTLIRWRRLDSGPPWFRVGRKSIRYRRGDVRAWLDAQLRGGDVSA